MHRYSFIPFCILLILCFFFTSSLKAQRKALSPQLIEKIDSIFTNKEDYRSPGSSIIIIEHEQLIFSKNYGISNVTFDLPFNNKTVFPLHGFSEQLAVFSILQMQENGLLRLSDPVNKYLPDLGFPETVTLAHLINHSSGLPLLGSIRIIAGYNFSDPFYQQDFLHILKCFTPGLKPDEKYDHSHSGIKILQLIIEKVSEKTFPEYVDTHIFRPLGMNNTIVDHELYKKNKHNSIGYSRTDDGFQVQQITEYAAMCPTTYSSQEDFTKWMINIQTKKFEGNIIKQLDQMLSLNGKLQPKENRAHCIGQQKYYNYFGQDKFYFMEEGEGHAWKWARLVQSGLSIMAVGNSDTYIGDRVAAVISELVEQPSVAEETTTVVSTDKKTIHMTEEELQAYTGYFWDNTYLFTTHISIRDGKLFYEDLDNGWNFGLTQLSENLFESPPWNKVEITNLEGQKKLKLMLRDGREFPSVEFDPTVIQPKEYPKYTGIYSSDKLNTLYKLVIQDEKLIMKRNRKADLELIPIGKNKFRTREIDFRLIEFQEDEMENISTMNISNFSVKNVEFLKT